MFTNADRARRLLSVVAVTTCLAVRLAGQAQAPPPAPSQAAPPAAGFTPLDPFDQIKALGRGVNIIGYDPIWRNFSQARFQDRHFHRIHDAGFQTVRVNLQAFSHMDAANRLNPIWLQTLDWVVDHAVAARLNVIIDEHDYTACAGDAARCKARLTAFWEQVAPRYKNAPAGVAFEILNEPNGQITPELWNEYLKDALAIIRQTNPTRNVIIGPGSWNNIHYLDRLQLPEDDRHLIATVHYYLPMEFTHQGARWSAATANLKGITWGTDAEKRAVVEDFAGVQKWSVARKRPILLGEFGAYDRGGADIDSRVRYTSFLVRTAESLGWAWTYWQFDSDFVVYDIPKDEWVQPILKALIP
jgi:endoglucanase